MTEPTIVLPPGEPIPVTVRVGEERYPGFVTAWRGQRVLVRYTTAPGFQYWHWVPASDVERLYTPLDSPHTADSPPPED